MQLQFMFHSVLAETEGELTCLPGMLEIAKYMRKKLLKEYKGELRIAKNDLSETGPTVLVATARQ